MRLFLIAAAAVTLDFGSLAHAQTCAEATMIYSNASYFSDTTSTTNWMFQFGPLASGANDKLYTFVAGAQPLGTITPTASNYAFAMYLIPSCSDSGSEPSPIRATATVGNAITLGDPPPPGQPSIVAGARYYLAVTGTAATSANGTVSFENGVHVPVSLQSFIVD
jgi:hypothetical protein